MKDITLKCPVCRNEPDPIVVYPEMQFVKCVNPECKISDYAVPHSFWQAIPRMSSDEDDEIPSSRREDPLGLVPPCPICNELPTINDGDYLTHRAKCDQVAPGRNVSVAYTPKQWWKLVALRTHCDWCDKRPGYDDYRRGHDDYCEPWERGKKYHHVCAMSLAGTGLYTPVDWWFHNTQVHKFATMPHSEELLRWYLSELRKT